MSNTTMFSAAATGGTLGSQPLLALDESTLTGSSLTSMPVEDITVLRAQLNMQVILTGGGVWTISCMKVNKDVTAMTNTAFNNIADKRVLYHQTFASDTLNTVLAGFVSANWDCPNILTVDATVDIVTDCAWRAVNWDFKVNTRLEADEKLVLVATEESGNATLGAVLKAGRLLMRRTPR